MFAARYFALVREMKDNAYNHRLRLVESARERGIKPTARLFATTAPTVRKWLRRFQRHGPSGLLAGLADESFGMDAIGGIKNSLALFENQRGLELPIAQQMIDTVARKNPTYRRDY